MATAQASTRVNDITQLNRVEVGKIVAPQDTDDIKRAINSWRGSISIGGGRYSMGGQIAAHDSLHFDMRSFNKLVRLDVAQKQIRVQAGMRWRDLQTLIDPHDLSVKIMQSYANFTVGGALSVNAHGRYVGAGPMVNSIRSLQVVLPSGAVVEASRENESKLFYGTIGGYGGLGVVTEVELDLVPNLRIERSVDHIPLASYASFFGEKIAGNPDAVLHNGDMDLSGTGQVTSVTWLKSEKPLTIQERLRPIGEKFSTEAAAVWALSELPNSQSIRHSFLDPLQYKSQPVVWRNYEASLDVASLGKIAGDGYTFALDEYFLPVQKLEDFAYEMMRILKAHEVNALNVSIRHSPMDSESRMAWAQQEVFSFVLYYKQFTTSAAQQKVGEWTRQLIETAIEMGGTYYLPYQLHATRAQFERAYPSAKQFFALKAEIDPDNRFRNKLWDKYALI